MCFESEKDGKHYLIHFQSENSVLKFLQPVNRAYCKYSVPKYFRIALALQCSTELRLQMSKRKDSSDRIHHS